MPMRELEVSIAADGTVDVHIKGYKGKRCHEAAKMLEEIVGQMKSQRETSEFYEPEEQVQYHVENRH